MIKPAGIPAGLIILSFFLVLFDAVFGSALLEAKALAVHFQDVDMMGEPVQQSAGEAFGSEDLGPFVEWQVGGDNQRASFVALRYDFEQQLGAGF